MLTPLLREGRSFLATCTMILVHQIYDHVIGHMHDILTAITGGLAFLALPAGIGGVAAGSLAETASTFVSAASSAVDVARMMFSHCL